MRTYLPKGERNGEFEYKRKKLPFEEKESPTEPRSRKGMIRWELGRKEREHEDESSEWNQNVGKKAAYKEIEWKKLITVRNI